jgi:hypothetical protein
MRPKKQNPTAQNLAERRWYERNKEYKRKRANSRNKARRKVASTVGASKIHNKEIDHKDGNPMNNSKKNLRVAPKSHGRKRYSRKGGTYKRYV